jgi:hypothetical protein
MVDDNVSNYIYQNSTTSVPLGLVRYELIKFCTIGVSVLERT